MDCKNRKYYLLNLVFIIGLMVLLINDHYLKLEYSNWLTGKLSDVMGLIIFPMFLTYLFPKSIKLNVVLTGLFFLFWKSPLSQAFLEMYNQVAFIKINRVVDYTDLIALICLPVSYFVLMRINEYDKLKLKIDGLNPIILVVPVMFIFMATSPPHYYKYISSEGELKCYKCSKKLKYSKEEVLSILAKNDYKVTMDSLPNKDGFRYGYDWKDSTNTLRADYPYYKIDTILIDQDTITDFQFALEKISDTKTKIWINAMNIPKEIPNDKVERKLKRYYRRLIKKHIKQSLRINGS